MVSTFPTASRASSRTMGDASDVADMMHDPQYQARGMFETVDVPTGRMEIPAILPRLDGTPGYTTHAGPEVGVDTDDVLGSIGFTEDEIKSLRNAGEI